MAKRRSGMTPEKNPGSQVRKARNPRKRYGVTGYPVAQSASPRIHRHWGEQYHKRICYDPIPARRNRFEEVVREFFVNDGRGLNVTSPHKLAAHKLCDKLSERAQACGAVNLLEMRNDGVCFGDNTDGAGLVRDLSVNLGFTLQGKRIAVIGAGGAARGILTSLLDEGPAGLLLASRKVQAAQAVVADLGQASAIETCALRKLAGRRFDLVINATSAGFKGRVPAIPTEIILKDALCYDLAYGKAAHPFRKYAERKGAARAVDGWGMLVEQAAESFLIWHKVRPDTAYVLATPGKFIPRDSGL